MKMVLNKCFGGFGIADEYLPELGVERWPIQRDNPKLIELVEKVGEKVGDEYSELCVVEIPDEATDWEMNEYDGIETITYVLDGKLYHC